MNEKLQPMLKEFLKLQKDAEKLEAKLTELNGNGKDARGAIPELQDKIIAIFDAERLQNITIKGLGAFHIHPSSYPKVEDEPKLFAWLKKNKLTDLIKEKVNYQTLRGLVNERLKDNMSLPEGVTTYDKRTLVHKTK